MIEFVMYQPGCPCCTSHEPLLIKDIKENFYSVGVGDPSEVIPPTVALEVYQAPYKNLAELFGSFRKEPVNWEGKPDAWRHIIKTSRKVEMQTSKVVL